MILESLRKRGLRIPFFLRGADAAIDGVAGIVRAAIQIERAAHFAFQLPGRFAGDEVDRAAHRAGPVEHRCIALGDLDLGDVGRQEAAEIETIVGRQINADAVDRERHLEPIEAAHEDQPFVARTAAIGRGDARHDIHRIVERLAVKGVDRLRRERLAADFDALGTRCGDDNLPEFERAGVVGGGWADAAVGAASAAAMARFETRRKTNPLGRPAIQAWFLYSREYRIAMGRYARWRSFGFGRIAATRAA